ncbi:MAG: hypothetical protein J6K89_03900, partial [Oscillospiraceae bacterium]|nr:hypothetical protein [Oscillospiraceae bacterium]
MKIMEKLYKCKNGIEEKTQFFVGDNTRVHRGWRKASKERKQEQNMQSCVRKVARILNCNYDHKNGLLLTLDMDEIGINKLISKLTAEQQEILRKLRTPLGQIGTWAAVGKRKYPDSLGEAIEAALQALRAAVDHQVTLWLRRIKRKYDGKIKALIVVSDMDHETGELVRCHAHIPLMAEGISWDLLRKEWKLGSVDIRQFRNQPDYTP